MTFCGTLARHRIDRNHAHGRCRFQCAAGCRHRQPLAGLRGADCRRAPVRGRQPGNLPHPRQGGRWRALAGHAPGAGRAAAPARGHRRPSRAGGGGAADAGGPFGWRAGAGSVPCARRCRWLGRRLSHGVARRRGPRGAHRAFTGVRSGASEARLRMRTNTRAHPRHRSAGHRAGSGAGHDHARRVLGADLGALPPVPDAAADDRLRRPLADGPPAGHPPAYAGSQRLPQRQLHDRRSWDHRRPRLGSGPHRRPHARSRLDLHQLLALWPQRPAGGGIWPLRGSLRGLRSRNRPAGGPGEGALLGGVRLLTGGPSAVLAWPSTTAAGRTRPWNGPPSGGGPRSAKWIASTC